MDVMCRFGFYSTGRISLDGRTWYPIMWDEIETIQLSVGGIQLWRRND